MEEPELTRTILGHILNTEGLLKNLDIDKSFFHNDKQRLVFREIAKGTRDAALIAERLKSTKGITSYISSLLDGLAKTDAENTQLYINQVKTGRLNDKLRKLLYQGSERGYYDDDKINELYSQISDFKITKKEYILHNLGSIEPKAIDWFWYNKIPSKALSFLVGDPGAGKSLLSLYMASIITNGNDWPDVKKTPGTIKGSIIILTGEDTLSDTVRVRADEMGADVNKIEILEGLLPKTNEFFDIRKHLGILEKTIKQIGDVKLIIFDPITAYMGNTEGNKNIQVRAALAPLKDLAEKYSLTIIGITHLNKDQAKKALYRSMGSVAFTATARSVWLVQVDEDNPRRRFFSPLKFNVCKNPTTLAFSIDGPIGRPKITFEPGTVDMTADELLADYETKERYSAIDEAKKFLIEALKDGPVESEQLGKWAEQQRISESSIKRAKRIMNINCYQKDKKWWTELIK